MAAYEWPVAAAPCHDVPETVAAPPGPAYHNISIGTFYEPQLQLLNTKCQSLKKMSPKILIKYLNFNAH
jgi:hypothetical protein